MAPLFLLLVSLALSSLLYKLLSANKRQTSPLPPGPRGWPVLGNLPQLGARPHQTLSSLSKKYGPLFRLRMGSEEVVVAASAAAAEQFLRVHDANFRDRPPSSGAEHLAYNYQDLVFAPYGPRWRMFRKLCAVHLFSTRALDDLRPVRAQEVSILAGALYGRSRAGCPVDLGHALTVCTTNALSMALLGRRVIGGEAEESREAAEFKDMVTELLSLAGLFNVADFVPALRLLDLQGVVGKMKALHRRFDLFFDRVIEEHRGVGTEGGDLLSVLMRLRDDVDGDGGKLTDSDIKALLLNMFVAGTETVSSVVEWAISEMIRGPEILKKAQTELDSVVGRDRLVSESDLPHLPYLHAVVKENFRLHPSTPLSLPRMSADACEVNGYHIPPRTTLLLNVWAIGRDPAVWADPLEFRPARFLRGGGYEHIDIKGTDFEVVPFGAGRRICAGLNLGLRMVQFVTATLAHAFDWALPEGLSGEKLDMEEGSGILLRRAAPLMVHPIPRLAQTAYETIC